jgi:hypothetical protein
MIMWNVGHQMAPEGKQAIQPKMSSCLLQMTIAVFTEAEGGKFLTSASRVAEATISRRSPRFF